LSTPISSTPIRRAVVLGLVALAALAAPAARAQGSVADFYRGRNLNLIVGAEGRLDHRHLQPRHGDGALDRRH
jgi:hypothetical protein